MTLANIYSVNNSDDYELFMLYNVTIASPELMTPLYEKFYIHMQIMSYVTCLMCKSYLICKSYLTWE